MINSITSPCIDGFGLILKWSTSVPTYFFRAFYLSDTLLLKSHIYSDSSVIRSSDAVGWA